MEIGRKIYYEKSNGIIIWDKGEMSGSLEPATFEQDAQIMPILNVLTSKNQLGVKELSYGELSSSFTTCKGYYINVTDNSIVFL